MSLLTLHLNIGLNITGGDNSPEAVAKRAQRAEQIAGHTIGLIHRVAFMRITYTAPDGADTEEPTLYLAVLAVGLDDWRQRVDYIATALGQDCIACAAVEGAHGSTADAKGELIGPRASAWGEFNPEFFRFPSGRTLADLQAA